MTGLAAKGPLMRLVVDGGTTALMMLAFAYWWQGNLIHEIAGTALFVILARHLLNNRNWWAALRRGRYDLRRTISLLLTLFLATGMTVLLLTSLAISRNVFAWLPSPDNFALREIHMFAAYWVMVIVGLHVGLNWHRVVTLARNLGMTGKAWRWIGWLSGLALAVQGLRSAAVMGVWTRLRFEYSLVMWDFNAEVATFFGHWLAILALFAVAMHAGMLILTWTLRARSEALAARNQQP